MHVTVHTHTSGGLARCTGTLVASQSHLFVQNCVRALLFFCAEGCPTAPLTPSPSPSPPLLVTSRHVRPHGDPKSTRLGGGVTLCMDDCSRLTGKAPTRIRTRLNTLPGGRYISTSHVDNPVHVAPSRAMLLRKSLGSVCADARKASVKIDG